MTDVNYLEYGNNAVRVLNTGEDFSLFMAQNSYALGVIIAIIIVIILILFILILGGKHILKLIP